MNAHPMDLPKLWTEVRADTQHARATLPSNAADDVPISQYQEFLRHNEIEFACDMLELHAEGHTVGKEFWGCSALKPLRGWGRPSGDVDTRDSPAGIKQFS